MRGARAGRRRRARHQALRDLPRPGRHARLLALPVHLRQVRHGAFPPGLVRRAPGRPPLLLEPARAPETAVRDARGQRKGGRLRARRGQDAPRRRHAGLLPAPRRRRAPSRAAALLHVPLRHVRRSDAGLPRRARGHVPGLRRAQDVLDARAGGPVHALHAGPLGRGQRPGPRPAAVARHADIRVLHVPLGVDDARGLEAEAVRLRAALGHARRRRGAGPARVRRRAAAVARGRPAGDVLPRTGAARPRARLRRGLRRVHPRRPRLRVAAHRRARLPRAGDVGLHEGLRGFHRVRVRDGPDRGHELLRLPASRGRDDVREIWGGNTTRNRYRHAW